MDAAKGETFAFGAVSQARHPPGRYNAVAETSLGRTTIEGIAEVALRRRIQRLGIERSPVVMVSNIYCPSALARLEKRACFYDYNDNPFQFSSTPSWAAPYWEQTVAQADAVFVVSEYYRRRLAETLKQPLIPLGNGVEYDRFASPRPVPPDLASSPRPWIGYLGLLSHFLDFETLESAARAAAAALGADRAGEPRDRGPLAELAARPGVVRLGPKPYEEVPAYLQALDVGVIPFRAQDPYVQGINPNKVYQFLASGCPVVTTPLLDLDQVPPSLQFAETAIEMVQAAHRALDQRPAVEACRPRRPLWEAWRRAWWPRSSGASPRRRRPSDPGPPITMKPSRVKPRGPSRPRAGFTLNAVGRRSAGAAHRDILPSGRL